MIPHCVLLFSRYNLLGVSRERLYTMVRVEVRMIRPVGMEREMRTPRDHSHMTSEIGHPQVPEYKGYPRPKTRNEANEAKRVPASMTGCAFYPMISAWNLVKCDLCGFPRGGRLQAVAHSILKEPWRSPFLTEMRELL